MPYSGPNDDKLPDHVKKMSAKKRAQWVKVWMATYNESHDEGKAFKYANGVVKSVNAEFLDQLKEFLGIKPKNSTFRFLEVDGQLRFFTTFTNCFKDAHSEIISVAAHQEYVEWVNKTKQYPQLWLWHAGPASKWGQVDFVDYVDGFVVASGLVDSDKTYIAKAIEKEDVKVSHGFKGLLTSDKVFIRYRTFEISPLPANRAANSWTDFNITGGKEMPFNDERKKWLKEIGKYSDEKITEIETSLSQLGESLKAAGMEWKSDDGNFDEVIAVTKGLTDVLAKVAEYKSAQDTLLVEVEALKTKVAEFDTRVTEATKSLEDKVAEAFKPQNAPIEPGFKASESNTTVVEGKKEDLSWFEDIVSSLR